MTTNINEKVARKLGWNVAPLAKHLGGHLVRSKGSMDWVEHVTGFDVGAVDYVPDYCHSIEVAWEIVDFLNKQTFSEKLEFVNHLKETFRLTEDSFIRPDWWIFHVNPRNICEAFLSIKDVDK